jgi:hypothetical protein
MFAQSAHPAQGTTPVKAAMKEKRARAFVRLDSALAFKVMSLPWRKKINEWSGMP